MGMGQSNTYSHTTADLEAIFFIDSDNGYVAGWNGAVLKTSNGGIVGLNIKITAVNLLKIYPNPVENQVTISTKTPD